MELIDIDKSNIKIGDIAVIGSKYSDNVFYQKIRKIYKKKIFNKITGDASCVIIETNNENRYSLKTSQDIDDDNSYIIKYKREDQDILNLRDEYNKLYTQHENDIKRHADAINELISSYIKEHNITIPYLCYNSNGVRIDVCINETYKKLDEILDKLESVTAI